VLGVWVVGVDAEIGRVGRDKRSLQQRSAAALRGLASASTTSSGALPLRLSSSTTAARSGTAAHEVLGGPEVE
jgi:hypothetical protein